MKYLYKLFETVCKGDLPFPPHLLFQSFLSAWTHGYLCSNLGCNPVLCYFMAQIVPGLSIGHSFRFTLESFWHSLSVTFIYFLSNALFSETERLSQFILCSHCPTATDVFKKLWFLLLENHTLYFMLSQGSLYRKLWHKVDWPWT